MPPTGWLAPPPPHTHTPTTAPPANPARTPAARCLYAPCSPPCARVALQVCAAHGRARGRGRSHHVVTEERPRGCHRHLVRLVPGESCARTWLRRAAPRCTALHCTFLCCAVPCCARCCQWAPCCCLMQRLVPPHTHTLRRVLPPAAPIPPPPSLPRPCPASLPLARRGSRAFCPSPPSSASCARSSSGRRWPSGWRPG